MTSTPKPKQPKPSAAHKRLEVFIGAWNAEGTSYGDGQDAADPRAAGVLWTSDESYEWLPGGFFEPTERSRLRTMALSRWENEGGAVIEMQGPETMRDNPSSDSIGWTDAELVQLRIRVIALENLVIALLAQAPQRQLALVREMADYISPRPGYTPHPLTLRAAAEMLSLADRSGHFRSPPTA
jgi:hypothetical protein